MVLSLCLYVHEFKKKYIINLTTFYYSTLISASQSSSVSGVSSASAVRSGANKGAPVPGQASVADEGEDTMKNLRKTFAGIFGDM